MVRPVPAEPTPEPLNGIITRAGVVVRCRFLPSKTTFETTTRLNLWAGALRSLRSSDSSPSCPTMMARHPLTILRHQFHLVRGGFVTARGRFTRRSFPRALVLLMYVVMNLGLPTGFGPQVKANSSKDVCRCSAESRAAGRCCCAKGAESSAKTGCCATRVVSTAKSCCAKKQTAAPVQTLQHATDDSIAWTGACPCGPVDTPVMLFCPHPRILADAHSLEVQFISSERIATLTDAPCGLRTRPSVPPPEFAV